MTTDNFTEEELDNTLNPLYEGDPRLPALELFERISLQPENFGSYVELYLNGIPTAERIRHLAHGVEMWTIRSWAHVLIDNADNGTTHLMPCACDYLDDHEAEVAELYAHAEAMGLLCHRIEKRGTQEEFHNTVYEVLAASAHPELTAAAALRLAFSNVDCESVYAAEARCGHEQLEGHRHCDACHEDISGDGEDLYHHIRLLHPDLLEKEDDE